MLSTGEVDIGGDDVRTVLRQTPAGGRADTTCRARHQHNVTRKLALRRGHFELILLERPVFDGIALGVGERDEAAAGFRAAHHRDRAVVELG